MLYEVITIQLLAQEIYPKLSSHIDEIRLDKRYFDRVKVVYENKDKFNLNDEQAFLLESVYQGFVRSGANLPEDKKEELKKINQELSTLTLKYEQNVITSYSIHYTKLYEATAALICRQLQTKRVNS